MSMLAVRIASRIPTNPASGGAQDEVARSARAVVLTPASAAPSRLPPTATVYIPQRVNDSTTWRRIAIPIAQNSSE